MSPQAEQSSGLWSGVGRLIERTRRIDDLRAHGLHLLAAQRWRDTGATVPDELALEELLALQKTFDAEQILRRAREAYDGRLALLKGPELASRYPASWLRPFSDLDLLADDAEQVQRALVAAGFRAIGPFADDYYRGLHHLRPLHLPGTLSVVEVHRRLSWVEWCAPPSTDELLADAVPARTGVDGTLALRPAQHALAVAAHSWAERPMRRILDLVDVAALADEANADDIRALASAWGLARVWSTTVAAAEALILGAPAPRSLRTWARELEAVRSRTVAEDHVRRWVSPFWALPAHRAVAASVVAVARGATPVPGESWGNKLLRVREAVTHPGRSTFEHGRVLGPEGFRPRFKRP